jgi:MacB-like periplasmic core domain
MLRYSLRGVFAAKGRLLLTAVAIVLGVGAVAGTLVLTDTVRVAAEAAYAEPVPRVDVVVRAGAAGEGEVFSDITGELFAQPMPASALEEVLAVDGVAAAAGVVSGDAHLLGRDGRVVGGGRAPLGRSVDPSFAKDLLDGRVPRGPGEVAIDGRTAREQRFGVGDRVRVVASGGEPATSTVAASWTRRRSRTRSCWSATIPPPPGGCSPPARARSAGWRSTPTPGSPPGRSATVWPRASAPATRRSPRPSWPPSAPATPPRPKAATPSSSSSPAWSHCSSACS